MKTLFKYGLYDRSGVAGRMPLPLGVCLAMVLCSWCSLYMNTHGALRSGWGELFLMLGVGRNVCQRSWESAAQRRKLLCRLTSIAVWRQGASPKGHQSRDLGHAELLAFSLQANGSVISGNESACGCSSCSCQDLFITRSPRTGGYFMSIVFTAVES